MEEKLELIRQILSRTNWKIALDVNCEEQIKEFINSLKPEHSKRISFE